MVRPAFTDVTSSSRFARLAVLRNGEYLVSSETEPSIWIYDRNGVQIASLPIPAWFAVTGVTGQVIVVGYGSKGRAVIGPGAGLAEEDMGDRQEPSAGRTVSRPAADRHSRIRRVLAPLPGPPVLVRLHRAGGPMRQVSRYCPRCWPGAL